MRASDYYRHGRGVTADRGKAASILKRSCDQHEHPRACMEYGWMSKEGWMFEVERSATEYRDYVWTRTRNLAGRSCDAGNVDACMVKIENEKRILDEEGWPDPNARKDEERERGREAEKLSSEMLRVSRKACEDGHGGACRFVIEEIEKVNDRGFLKKSSSDLSRYEKEAEKNFLKACEAGDNDSCILYLQDGFDESNVEGNPYKYIAKLMKAPCERGHAESCFVANVLAMLVVDGEPLPEEAMQAKAKELIAKVVQGCSKSLGPFSADICGDFLDQVIEGNNPEMGLAKPDPGRAIDIRLQRCLIGSVEDCQLLHEMAMDEDSSLHPKNKQLIRANAKLCELTPYGEECGLCVAAAPGSSPKHKLCRTRLAWKERLDCDEGKEDRCEVLASMYQTGDGVSRDLSNSVGYYRLACDSALKSSCATLEQLCSSNATLEDDERCMQSLIHSDVFYEAEWQFRQTGSAKVLGEGGANGKSEVGAVALAAQAGASGAGISLQRGSLDADLVVSIVLDRARQAAIQLVVSELKRASKSTHIPIYLEDLLTQASLLLADKSSMRREKFQDLGMTVVRAFVASNLTKTLFPSAKSLLEHEDWATWAAEAKLEWNPKAFKETSLSRLRSYLTDWVYYGLAETPLFGRAVGDRVRIPTCPFKKKSTKVACALLLDDEGNPRLQRLARLLRIQDMLQGLSLAKALREEGSIDLRRFIEAIGRSQTIANLRSTPGLNIAQWKKDLAEATATRLRDVQQQLEAAQVAFSVDGLFRLDSLEEVHEVRIQAEKMVGPDSHYLALLDVDNIHTARTILAHIRELERIARLGEELEEKIDAASGLKLGGGGADPAVLQAQLDQTHRDFEEERRKMKRALESWSDSKTFLAKLDKLHADIDATRPLMLELRRSLVEIETMLKRYKPPRLPGADVTVEVEASFEISHVPLHALPDLKKHFQNVATTLVSIDKQLGKVFPGSARPKLKFAVSAVVRLLGFFDMMERVARTARLNQTCGDVIAALKLLGSVSKEDFSAPLFDVMDPVLQSIKTHEPMDVDLLFTVISKVRLDSLITSLAKDAKKPCQNSDRGIECWTFKIIHSLQEAVQRDGQAIRIDGGAFAKRLASHGDDFRRRHKWRGYFHLTVGLGGLYSNAPSVDGMEAPGNRAVPLVGEQIGFGWASPTFWNDTLTFKFGGYGSGLLYRATIDSTEANAIMASPFVALDIYDLVELYAGPMVLFYPPTDTDDAQVSFGASAGITVPLSAYLEKL